MVVLLVKLPRLVLGVGHGVVLGWVDARACRKGARLRLAVLRLRLAVVSAPDDLDELGDFALDDRRQLERDPEPRWMVSRRILAALAFEGHRVEERWPARRGAAHLALGSESGSRRHTTIRLSSSDRFVTVFVRSEESRSSLAARAGRRREALGLEDGIAVRR